MAKSSDLSVLNMPKELIMTQIFETHAHADIKFDVCPVFTVVKKILNRASDVVQHVVMVYILLLENHFYHRFLLNFFPLEVKIEIYL